MLWAIRGAPGNLFAPRSVLQPHEGGHTHRAEPSSFVLAEPFFFPRGSFYHGIISVIPVMSFMCYVCHSCVMPEIFPDSPTSASLAAFIPNPATTGVDLSIPKWHGWVSVGVHRCSWAPGPNTM